MLLVNALLSATRWMTSSGAMAYPIRRRVSQPVRLRSGSWESTNLGLSEERQENTLGVVVGAPRCNKQRRVHRVKGARLNEHGDNGLG